MIDRDAIEAMIPHKHGMCLWDAVRDWDDARIRLRTRSHARADNPLRSAGPLDGGEVLRAVHLCEYGAQAMAVHGGLRGAAAGDAPKVGFLVALRNIALHCARIDTLPGEIEGEAELLADSATTQQYAFRLFHDGTLLAEGRAAVMLEST